MKNKKNFKKRSILRNNKMMGALFICILFLTSALVFNLFFKPVKADATKYVQVKVIPGDTLWNIAEKYNKNDDIRNLILEIQKTNNLKNCNIYVDQILNVPIKD